MIGIVGLWLFSKQRTDLPVAKVLLWLAVAGGVLALPNIGLIYGLHHWTEAQFGIGARTIGIANAAAGSR